jgi:hypothetical protein
MIRMDNDTYRVYGRMIEGRSVVFFISVEKFNNTHSHATMIIRNQILTLFLN